MIKVFFFESAVCNLTTKLLKTALNRAIISLTAFLILVCAAANVLSSEINSEDWIYLEQEGVDAFLGAFHDKRSGAFIAFEVGIPSLLSEAAPVIAADNRISLEKGESAGWSYSLVLIPEERTEFTRNACPIASSPDSAQALIISFTGDDAYFRTWNFTALICNSLQLDRCAAQWL